MVQSMGSQRVGHNWVTENNNNGHLGKKKKNRPLVLSAFENQFRTWTREPDWRDSKLLLPTHPVILGKLPLGSVSSSVCVHVCVHAHAGTHTCAQLCPMDCCLPGSSVHGIFQARIQEWVDMSSSREIFPTQGLNPFLLHYMWIHHIAPPSGKPLSHM